MSILKIITMTSCILGAIVPSTQGAPLPQGEDFAGIPSASRVRRDFGTVSQIGGINVISLSGSYTEMGMQYGTGMQQLLNETYNTIVNYLMTDLNLTPSHVMEQTTAFNNRYMSSPYGDFLVGVAAGSGLSLETCMVLNAMETFMKLQSTPAAMCLANNQVDDPLGYCTFAFIPPNLSSTGSSLIGRTYDFQPPFDQIAQMLTVTLLFANGGATPTAIISLPGQIYCPTCITSTGNFLELNAGMPSGGWNLNNVQSLLVSMLVVAQSTSTFSQLTAALATQPYDYSLIVNVASGTSVQSLEYSTNRSTVEAYTPPANTPFASTNFFQSPAWTNLPVPTDACTWKGVTRQSQMANLINGPTIQTDASLLTIMDTNIDAGGAVWWDEGEGGTVYQVAYDTHTMSLSLKVTRQPGAQWATIPLGTLFCDGGSTANCASSGGGLTEDEIIGISFGSAGGAAVILGILYAIFK